MITLDVNVLVDAQRPSSPHHSVAKGWLEKVLVAEVSVGLWDVTMISAYRILTDPRIWAGPETPSSALGYLNELRRAPAFVPIEPGPAFWATFQRLVLDAEVRGPLTSDAMLAALAIEHRCRLATFDRDFARFKDLKTFEPSA